MGIVEASASRFQPTEMLPKGVGRLAAPPPDIGLSEEGKLIRLSLAHLAFRHINTRLESPIPLGRFLVNVIVVAAIL
jgi:hypothetical protein